VAWLFETARSHTSGWYSRPRIHSYVCCRMMQASRPATVPKLRTFAHLLTFSTDKKRMKAIKALVLAAVLVIPAFPRAKGTLYRLDTRTATPFEFTRSIFKTTGKIWANLDGTQMEGQYIVVRGGASGWGTVYSSVVGGGRIVTGSGQTLSSWTSDTAQGSAILTGVGKMLTCEFLVGSTHGMGGCRDQDGHRYRLLF